MSKKSVPSYAHHKPSRRAYVYIAGKRIYLGEHGTPESHRRYAEEIAKWQDQQEAATENATVKQLTLCLFTHCEQHYRKNGELTSEYELMRLALRQVESVFQGDVLSGHWFDFLNRRRDRVKILAWDHDGLMLVYKRLERGNYQVPRTSHIGIELDAVELSMLLSGVDFRTAQRRKRYRKSESPAR